MSKARAGRVARDIAPQGRRISRHHRLFGGDAVRSGYVTAKILGNFEGTQQIKQLVVARRLLGLWSAELKWLPPLKAVPHHDGGPAGDAAADDAA